MFASLYSAPLSFPSALLSSPSLTITSSSFEPSGHSLKLRSHSLGPRQFIVPCLTGPRNRNTQRRSIRYPLMGHASVNSFLLPNLLPSCLRRAILQFHPLQYILLLFTPLHSEKSFSLVITPTTNNISIPKRLLALRSSGRLSLGGPAVLPLQRKHCLTL